MNAPRRPDGPPVRDGKPYSAIAHLAEDVVPYVALAAGLRDLGLSAPEILHADLDRGLIVMEDFGDERVVARRSAGADRGALRRRGRSVGGAARRELPDALPVTPQLDYRLPRYDMDAFLIEAELLLDWYLVRAERRSRRQRRASFRQAVARGAAAGDRRAADLGAARLSFAQSAVAAASATTLPASAFSISRMR